MKKSLNLILLMSAMLMAFVSNAQYDDVYFDANAIHKKSHIKTSNVSDYNTDPAYAQNDQAYSDQYDDDSYSYLDDYDYGYTHRIRRFHRPLIGRSFYDPYYLDPWNYDPYYYSYNGFASPFISLNFFTYNDYFRWSRWSRFNSLRYFDPYGYSYFSEPYYYGAYSSFYWSNPFYCPLSWYSNRYYYGNSYWANPYNGVYQSTHYANNSNVHFGARTYGATLTGDNGITHTSGRAFPSPSSPSNPGLGRISPRDASTTIVRERPNTFGRGNEPIGNSGISNGGDRLSPRAFDQNTVRERPQSDRTFRTYRDFDNGSTGATPTSPRSNDGFRSSLRSIDRERFQSDINPRIRGNEDTYSSPRNFSPRFEAPQQRFDSPRQSSPRFEAPSHSSPRWESAPQQFSSPRQSAPSPSFNGGSNFGGGGGGGHSSSGGGGGHSSPRHN